MPHVKGPDDGNVTVAPVPEAEYAWRTVIELDTLPPGSMVSRELAPHRISLFVVKSWSVPPERMRMLVADRNLKDALPDPNARLPDTSNFFTRMLRVAPANVTVKPEAIVIEQSSDGMTPLAQVVGSSNAPDLIAAKMGDAVSSGGATRDTSH